MLKILNILVIILAISNCEQLSSSIITLDNTNLVNIRGEINKLTNNKFIIDMEKINYNKEIYVYINSPGGSVIEGFAMIEYIKNLQQQKITISCIADFAASIAFVILQHCNNRYAFYSSIMMQHSMSLQLKGSLPTVDSYLKMLHDINIHLNTYQATKVKLSLDNFVKKTTSDWWVSGLTAISENVVDKIVTIRCNPSLNNIYDNVNINTLFGDITINYSKCPLISHYHSIILPNNISTIELAKIIETNLRTPSYHV